MRIRRDQTRGFHIQIILGITSDIATSWSLPGIFLLGCSAAWLADRRTSVLRLQSALFRHHPACDPMERASRDRTHMERGGWIPQACLRTHICGHSLARICYMLAEYVPRAPAHRACLHLWSICGAQVVFDDDSALRHYQFRGPSGWRIFGSPVPRSRRECRWSQSAGALPGLTRGPRPPHGDLFKLTANIQTGLSNVFKTNAQKQWIRIPTC